MAASFNYMWAEIHMQHAKRVRRKDWPAGKEAYHDIENDGIPDEIDVNDADFLRKSQAKYESFKANIRIALDGQVHPEAYITQEDSLAEDWQIIE